MSCSILRVVASAICLRRGAAHFGQPANGLNYEGRFIAFAAMRNRRQIGAIRLHQKPVLGRNPRAGAHCIGFRKCEHAPESSSGNRDRALARAWVSSPVKQCMMPLPRRACSMARVSSQASRVWITIGLPDSAAIANCRSKTARCTSRGEKS